jgi:hypothetical protein
MTTRLGQRGWTAAPKLAPCVLCQRPAILRSPRDKPCHWTCAMAWLEEHQDHDDERGQGPRSIGAITNSSDHCPACSGGLIVRRRRAPPRVASVPFRH